MKFQQFKVVVFLAMFIVCFSPRALLAGTFGSFTYVDNGSSVTISECEWNIGGDVVIPSSIGGKPVTAIGSRVFETRHRIRSISIPPSVTSIGKGAFYHCTGLRTMSLPPGITSIDDGVFEYCRSLTGVTIPAGVGRIGQFAFNGCNQLDAVVIPASVTEIGANAFAECKIIALNIPENVKTIGDYAFSDCDTQSIKIHSSETAMGTGVFASCGKLKAVDFPPGTREIAASTFASCHALQSLTIPPSVKRIDTSAFAYSGLKRIDLGSSLTRIGSDAFSHCSDLRMVTLPRSLKEVGDGAFEYCEKLLNVWFLGDAPAMGKLVFQRTTPDFVIYFAARSIDYTIPRWHGYRASLAKEEIEVQAADGSIVIDAQGFTRLGSTIVGETSRSKRFVIRNVGVLKLTGLHARISGGDSSDFIIKTLTKNSLAPGQTAILEILFQPKQRGKRSSQLHIMSSDANEDPFEVDLSAIGLQLIK